MASCTLGLHHLNLQYVPSKPLVQTAYLHILSVITSTLMTRQQYENGNLILDRRGRIALDGTIRFGDGRGARRDKENTAVVSAVRIDMNVTQENSVIKTLFAESNAPTNIENFVRS